MIRQAEGLSLEYGPTNANHSRHAWKYLSQGKTFMCLQSDIDKIIINFRLFPLSVSNAVTKMKTRALVLISDSVSQSQQMN